MGCLRAYADAFPAANLTVCRLDAGRDTLTERILRRGRGEGPTIPGDDLKFLPPAELQRVAEQPHHITLGDWSVDTDGRSVEDIAEQIAAQALTMPHP